VHADRDIAITSGRAVESVDAAGYTKSSSLLSSSSTTRTLQQTSDTSLASTFQGGLVAITAGKDIAIAGRDGVMV